MLVLWGIFLLFTVLSIGGFGIFGWLVFIVIFGLMLALQVVVTLARGSLPVVSALLLVMCIGGINTFLTGHYVSSPVPVTTTPPSPKPSVMTVAPVVAPPAVLPVAKPVTATTPSETTINELAKRLRNEYRDQGMSGLSASVQNCYKSAGSAQDSLRICMLYDVAVFRLDVRVLKSMNIVGHSTVEYFSGVNLNARLRQNEFAAFGSHEAGLRFLNDASILIVTRSLTNS